MRQESGTETRSEAAAGYGGEPAEAGPGRRRGAATRLRRYAVSTRLVRHGRPSGGLAFACAADIYRALKHLRHYDREAFVVMALDVKNRVLAVQEASLGTLDATLVHPREVFKAAILAGAASVALVHNHPSGDPEPSREDREITDRLVQAGRIVGIQVLDHVIVGAHGFVSFSERGWL